LITIRLWHQELIKKLPRQQLLGQHREVLALIGLGWGRNHSTVNYAFKHSDIKLVQFYNVVYTEMLRRGYKPNYDNVIKQLEKRHTPLQIYYILQEAKFGVKNIYPEHDEKYLQICLDNLAGKNVYLE